MGNEVLCCGARSSASSASRNTYKDQKVFQSNIEPRCVVCEQKVYVQDKVLNSKGLVFHKKCLRCCDSSCRVSLVGKAPVTSSIDTQNVLQSNEYRFERTDDNKVILKCHKHGSKAVTDLVQGKDKFAKAESHRELCITPEVIAQKESVRDHLTLIMGDYVPTCSKCGFGFEKNSEMILQGMQKFHKTCPQLDKGDSVVCASQRTFVKMSADRLVLSISTDNGDKGKTFLFELNAVERDNVLLSNPAENQVIEVTYNPDLKAKSKWNRKLQSENVSRVSATVRDQKDFRALDPTIGKAYEAWEGIIYHGSVSIAGIGPVYMQIGFDKKIRYASSSGELLKSAGKDGKSANIVDISSAKVYFKDSLEDPGFFVLPQSGEKLLQVDTASWDQAIVWLNCLIYSKTITVQVEPGYIPIALQLFRTLGGIIMRMQITVLLSKSKCMVGCRDPVKLYFSHFPIAEIPKL